MISTLMSFCLLFGFIEMTPQLFINHKLKTVEHMNWNSMIYKFLNTIIDDLFAFMIPMPFLKRLSMFRDDVVFVIYLYQRWVYRVDNNRTVSHLPLLLILLRKPDSLTMIKPCKTLKKVQTKKKSNNHNLFYLRK